MRPAAAVFASFVIWAGVHSEGAAPLKAPMVPWEALHFQARKFVLSATSVIRADLQPAESLAPLLRQPPGEDGLVTSPWVVRISVTTDLPVSRDEEVQVWLDPFTFAALQTSKRAFGKHQYEKTFRYVTGGYYEWRRAPANDQEGTAPPTSWSALRESWARPAVSPASARLVDPYSLLYVVSAAQLHRGRERLSCLIVSRGKLVKLEFSDGGLTRRPVDYVEHSRHGEQRRRGDALVRLVHVAAAAIGGPGGDKVELGFLGMQGELTVALEASSGLPVELAGRSRGVGPLVVRLTRAEIGAQATP